MAGLSVGAFFGLPAIGYVLVMLAATYALFMLPFISVAVLFVAGAEKKDIGFLVALGIGAAAAFAPSFLLVTIDRADTGGIAEAFVGAWNAGWLATLMAAGFYAVRHYRRKRHAG